MFSNSVTGEVLLSVFSNAVVCRDTQSTSLVEAVINSSVVMFNRIIYVTACLYISVMTYMFPVNVE